MEHYVYADNAATTKLHPAALEAMLPWLTDCYGNASQPYSFARAPKKALADSRERIAACIGAQPDEIFFTSGGTESDNWALKGVALLGAGGIVASAIEHHAVLNTCEALKRSGCRVSCAYPNKDGAVTPGALSGALLPGTRVVSVMLANNEVGVIQPVRELAELSHEAGALFHTDAVQALGHIPVDVSSLGIDMLSGSAHKFNGPKGVGFLYVRRGVALNPYAHGGAQERGLRAGTENVASIVGMAAALEANCYALDENQSYVRGLEAQLLGALDSSGVVYVRNGAGATLPGLLSLSFPGKDGEAIMHRMDLMGIAVSTGAACDSTRTQVSHVLKAMRVPEHAAKGTVRISLGACNTEQDAKAIAAALVKIVGGK